jgi:hypothetical protein
VRDTAAALVAVASGGLPPGCTVANAIAFLPFMVYAGHLLLEMPASDGTDTARSGCERRMEGLIAGREKGDDAFALSLWVLSLEEWRWAKLGLLASALKAVGAGEAPDGQALFDRARAVLIVFALTNGIQERLKRPSGVEPAVVSGALSIPSHAGADWITTFMSGLADSGGFDIITEWRAFAEVVEREILQLDNAYKLFEYTKDSQAVAPDAIVWLRQQLG